MEHFLMTFRTFTSSNQVLMLLSDSYKQGSDDKAKKLRICNFLRRWLEAYYDDFEHEKTFYSNYLAFLEDLRKASASQALISILERAEQKGVFFILFYLSFFYN
jgi:hypothetical protein